MRTTILFLGIFGSVHASTLFLTAPPGATPTATGTVIFTVNSAAQRVTFTMAEGNDGLGACNPIDLTMPYQCDGDILDRITVPLPSALYSPPELGVFHSVAWTQGAIGDPLSPFYGDDNIGYNVICPDVPGVGNREYLSTSPTCSAFLPAGTYTLSASLRISVGGGSNTITTPFGSTLSVDISGPVDILYSSTPEPTTAALTGIVLLVAASRLWLRGRTRTHVDALSG